MMKKFWQAILMYSTCFVDNRMLVTVVVNNRCIMIADPLARYRLRRDSAHGPFTGCSERSTYEMAENRNLLHHDFCFAVNE